MRRGASVIVALALSFAAMPAASQDPEFLRQVGVDGRNAMLDRMDRMMCGSAMCAPASDEERASPPVTDEEASIIAAVAVVSAISEHCGLAWQERSFLPMMAHWRSEPDATVRRIALIGATHGYVQGQALEAFQASGECDEQTRAAAQSLLDQTRD